MKQIFATTKNGRHIFWTDAGYLLEVHSITDYYRSPILLTLREQAGTRKLHIITDDVDFGCGLIDAHPNEIFFGRLKVEHRCNPSSEPMPPRPERPYDPDAALAADLYHQLAVGT